MQPSDLFAQEPPETARLLRTAATLLFTYGYQAFTMDELAHELGVSKKTLYVHFRSKDAIIARIIELTGQRLRTDMENVVENPSLSFTQKLSGVVSAAAGTLTKLNPATLRDLQRFAPHLYAEIEALRSRIIPLVFGRLIRDGIAEGNVRRDIDPAFATEFWLNAIRGMVQPATLERTQLTLPETMARSLDLFFAGLLTPAGRKEYEKHS